MRHLRNWGAVYILALLFIGSWMGQLVAMQPQIAEKGASEFWSATFENWQSEWLQLIFQAVLLLGAKHWLFKADADDMERLQSDVSDIKRMLSHESSSR